MITVDIDEVGRGSWAGPVVAGAVVLRKSIAGLTDSKLLTKTKRRRLNGQIIDVALAYGIGWVEPAEVDNIGLTQAVGLAMQRALEQITINYDEIIIDGNYNFMPGNPKARTLIKADLTEPSVSAASIIAKVARDDYMAEQGKLFPAYGFENHVGYGTKQHLAALIEHGICEHHRLSYKPIQALL